MAAFQLEGNEKGLVPFVEKVENLTKSFGMFCYFYVEDRVVLLCLDYCGGKTSIYNNSALLLSLLRLSMTLRQVQRQYIKLLQCQIF